jgi:hypothetical protein
VSRMGAPVTLFRATSTVSDMAVVFAVTKKRALLERCGRRISAGNMAVAKYVPTKVASRVSAEGQDFVVNTTGPLAAWSHNVKRVSKTKGAHVNHI